VAVVSVLALLAAGFAAVNLSAGGRTGAASPEGAAERFFDSVGDEDLVGVLEVLDPAERDVMMPFVQTLGAELSRLGLTEDVNLQDVPGFDLEIEGLELDTQQLAPGIEEIAITGGVLRSTTEPDAVPVGDVLRDLIVANGGEVDIAQTSEETQLGGEDAFFIVTETDGRWHISMFFTIAEYARRDAGMAMPDLGAGVVPRGGSSPEDAVRQFADAAAGLDLERMISLLPPDEARALQTYAPLFLDDAQEDVEEFRFEEGFELTVDDLDLTVGPVDGGVRVVPLAGRFTLVTDEGDMTMAYGDGCIEVSGELAQDVEDDLGSTRVCAEDVEGLVDDLSSQEEADLRELGALFENVQPGIVVVERDGAYYVDPLRTFGDLWFQLFAGVEREDLEQGGILYRLFTGELDWGIDSGGTFGDDCDLYGETEDWADDC
jgi:hypothetical protein